MEPVVRGLRVDALATCPLGQVHAPIVSLEREHVVYHLLPLEQFTTLPPGVRPGILRRQPSYRSPEAYISGSASKRSWQALEQK